MSIFKKIILKNKAARSGIIYTLTNFFNAALPFLLLPILTGKLNETQYGLVSMVLVLFSIVQPLMSFGIEGSISRAYFRDEISNFQRYLTNCLYLAFIGCVLIVASFYFFGNFISKITEIPEPWYYASIFIALGTYLINVNLITYRVKFKALSYAAIKICQTILSFVVTYYLVVILEQGWQGVILARLIVIGVFALLNLGLLIKNKYIDLTIDYKYIKIALRFGIPLLPHLLSIFVIGLSDRFFISNILDLSSVGSYVVAYQIGTIIDMVANSLNLALSPWLYEKLKHFKENIKIIRKVTKWVMFGMTILAGLFLLLLPLILDIFISQEFDVSKTVIAVIVLGYVFQSYYLLFGNYFFYHGETKIISTITFSIAIFNIVLNFVLISAYGVIGAAIATTLSFFLKFLIVYTISNRKYKIFAYDQLA